MALLSLAEFPRDNEIKAHDNKARVTGSAAQRYVNGRGDSHILKENMGSTEVL